MLDANQMNEMVATRGLLPWADPYVAQLFSATISRDDDDGRYVTKDYSTVRYTEEPISELSADALPPILEPTPNFHLFPHPPSFPRGNDSDED